MENRAAGSVQGAAGPAHRDCLAVPIEDTSARTWTHCLDLQFPAMRGEKKKKSMLASEQGRTPKEGEKVHRKRFITIRYWNAGNIRKGKVGGKVESNEDKKHCSYNLRWPNLNLSKPGLRLGSSQETACCGCNCEWSLDYAGRGKTLPSVNESGFAKSKHPCGHKCVWGSKCWGFL